MFERASEEGSTRIGPIVNPARWAEQVVKEQACQNPADTKAFKGRGKLLELRQLLTELECTVIAMKHLVDITKQVQNSQMYLMLHVKTATGLTFLRWRERNGACRHVPWPEVQDRIDAFTSDVRDWYGQATDQALALNERHKELRRAIATARKVVMRSAPSVFARSIEARFQPSKGG
ncbi:hypothetical protein LPB72_09715 [Hydrogenophaga crassostreae]|uniref:Uncharacterized protein n=1 Tax=Hydrogenophaga crassostreae TaxID=1763535 RepID=A0ABX2U5X1_9BURK|nr:hypothetical protein LPB72_09715 [Hydrogenophaga crassostreae]